MAPGSFAADNRRVARPGRYVAGLYWPRFPWRRALHAAIFVVLLGYGYAQRDAGPTSAPSLATALDRHLHSLADAGRFSGVVLVAHDGAITYQGAFGYADAAGTPLSLDSRFALASLSKMFTAVAIGTLVQDGTVGLDDLVSDYLPGYPADRIEGVTIGQLLSHTSGLGNFAFEDIQPMRTVDEMLRLDVSPTVTAPGARFSYSNMGYVLLGAVIEQASGMPYDAYVAARVFGPSGMSDSGAHDLSPDTERLATGFTRFVDWTFRTDPGAPHPNDFFRVARGGPAGDLVSTAHDLLRFATALQRHDLLDSATTELFTEPHVLAFERGEIEAWYAFGFERIVFDGVPTLGHSGEAAGESTLLRIYPNDGTVLVVLANMDGVAHELGMFIHGLLMEP